MVCTLTPLLTLNSIPGHVRLLVASEAFLASFVFAYSLDYLYLLHCCKQGVPASERPDSVFSGQEIC